MSFIIISVAVVLLAYLVPALLYRRTSYYSCTKKPYYRAAFDRGNYGEYLTYMVLRKYEKDGARFLFNCYLKKEDDQTTEIDVMMIHRSGIYVFESKNYSGWIFGSGNSKYWTQTLPNGRKAHKEHFLNPIFQNNLHIKYLTKCIGQEMPIYSVVVFSNRCTLKKIDNVNGDVTVVKRNEMRKAVRAIEQKATDALQPDRVTELYEMLYPYTQVTEEVKQKHIADIKSSLLEQNMSDTANPQPYFESANETVAKTNGQICPKCGGSLVLRVANKGNNAGKEFYGCSNFPKCRYVKNKEE